VSLVLRELQGLVTSAYPRSPAGRYVLFEVHDARDARASLQGLASSVTFADHVEQQIRAPADDGQEGRTSMNVAFTAPGLAALGVTDDRMTDFSREFREGMVTPHRQRILGDLEGSQSDPLGWLWGGPRNPPVHGALLFYGADEALLDAYVGDVMSAMTGVRVVRTLLTVSLADSREHFGFRDGIASPWVDGLHRPRGPRDQIAAGEIVLGQPDNTGAPEPYPPLGRDGSYLVLRQLVQDVEGFWSTLRSTVGDARAVKWAAKMNGRWPDGTPLVRSPDGAAADPSDDFGYRGDPDGLRCPPGAHIRRTNPRDGIGPRAKDSIDLVKRHRLLRRGRAFGQAAAAETWPDGIEPVRVDSGRQDESGERGLFFACLVASLARQFEFVQHSWLNNPKLAGLYDENDPVTGSPPQRFDDAAPGFTFTRPGPVVNRRIELPQKFVHCKGGAYLLLPGRTALLALACEPTSTA
jgi:deferrochelatase/peroxidase EfeB